MKKQLLTLCMLVTLMTVPLAVFSAEFGMVDAALIFSKYNETQKTKSLLEAEKAKLQTALESRKKAVQKLDDEYLEVAKRMQELRDSKKEKEARALEPKLSELRQQLSQKSGELQEFFESSQRELYELEETQMGELSKSLDDKVETAIKQIALKHKMKAVFEKRFLYYGADKVVKDITNEVIAILNRGR